MDAAMRLTKRTIAYGQVVWSWSPDARIKSRVESPEATEANKPGLWGERGVSRKAIAQGVPCDFGPA